MPSASQRHAHWPGDVSGLPPRDPAGLPPQDGWGGAGCLLVSSTKTSLGKDSSNFMLASRGTATWRTGLGVQGSVSFSGKQQDARFICTSLSKLNQTLRETEVHQAKVTS